MAAKKDYKNTWRPKSKASEGPKKSMKVNRSTKRAVISRPSKRAELSSPYAKPKTDRKTPVTALPGNKLTAQAIRNAVNLLSRIPGGNAAANANLRKSVNRAYGMTKAEQAAKAETQRSRMAVDRAKAQAGRSPKSKKK